MESRQGGRACEQGRGREADRNWGGKISIPQCKKGKKKKKSNVKSAPAGETALGPTVSFAQEADTTAKKRKKGTVGRG